MVESRMLRAQAVLILSVARKGNEQWPMRGALRANALRYLIAVDFRQPDIEQHGVGTQCSRCKDRLLSVVGEIDVTARGAQQQGRAVGHVSIVVDDQHAKIERRGRCRHRDVDRRRIGESLRAHPGEPDSELASAIRTFAERRNASPMHLGQTPRERQTDAEASLGAIQRPFGLLEGFEDRRQQLPWNSGAGIADAENDFRFFARRRDEDLPALARVFRRIDDEVGQHLGNAREISLEPQRLGGQRHDERVLEGIERGSARFDRRGDHARDVDRLDLELDLAAGDARYIEQIVDETHQLAKLAADHACCPRELAGILLAVAQDVNRIADRRKRIAKLVREHGKELVLSAILLLYLFVEPRVVERDGSAAGQFGRHRERIGVERSPARA